MAPPHTTATITIVASVLAAASLLFLTAIAGICIYDYRNGYSLRPFDLVRAGSDTVTLIRPRKAEVDEVCGCIKAIAYFSACAE